MHRSGTSCLAGALQLAGAFAGDVIQYGPDNLKGHREHRSIMALSEAVLKHSGGSWNCPPEQLAWSSAQAQTRQTLIAEFSQQATLWMFKDPRTLLMLPFWQASLTPIYVGTVRHPLQVALSLNQRNQMPIALGLWLWQVYTQALIAQYQQSPFPIISFDQPAPAYLRSLTRLIERLNHQFGLDLSAAAAQSFYTSDLNHSQPVDWWPVRGADEPLQLLWHIVQQLYQQLCEAAAEQTDSYFDEAPATEVWQVPLRADVESCQRVIDAQPNNLYAHLLLAQQYEQEDMLEPALQAYMQALQTDASNYWIYEQLGQLLQAVRDWPSQIEFYQTAVQQLPDHPQLYYLLAMAQFEAGRYSDAIDSLTALLRQVPSHVPGQMLLGRVHLQSKQWDIAISTYERLLQLQPDHAAAHISLATALQRCDRNDESLHVSQQAVTLAPENVGGHRALGDSHWALGDWEQAIAAYQRAIQLAPEWVSLHLTLSRWYQQLEQWDEAQGCLQSALLLHPEDARLHVALGNLYLCHLQQPQLAIDCYQQALLLQPPRPATVYGSLGDSYFRLQQIDQAIEAYESALAIGRSPQLQKKLQTAQARKKILVG